MEISVDVRENLLRAKKILTSPKKFFKDIHKEKGWKDAFSFVLVVAFIGHIFTAIYNVIFYPAIASSVGTNLGLQPADYNVAQVVTASIVSYIVALAMSFIWAGALKVWLMLFKVDSTFAEAYRVTIYSRAPNYLLSWFPFVNAVVWFYSLYLMILALKSQYSLSPKKSMVIIASSVILLFIVSFLAFALLWQSSQL